MLAACYHSSLCSVKVREQQSGLCFLSFPVETVVQASLIDLSGVNDKLVSFVVHKIVEENASGFCSAFVSLEKLQKIYGILES